MSELKTKMTSQYMQKENFISFNTFIKILSKFGKEGNFINVINGIS